MSYNGELIEFVERVAGFRSGKVFSQFGQGLCTRYPLLNRFLNEFKNEKTRFIRYPNGKVPVGQIEVREAQAEYPKEKKSEKPD
ncbi:MAG: hypothetical protein HY879_08575 [Deltaproteobacteria bacterium]|nr:hypothetical protein [Deltaproteobacteria bacterium]